MCEFTPVQVTHAHCLFIMQDKYLSARHIDDAVSAETLSTAAV
jgi:hypothetical protein